MNERIRLLAEQAGFKVNWQHEDVQAIKMARFEKFAELIVKECIAICQDIDGEDNIDAKSGRQDCAVEIKEQFGVEL